MNQNEIKEAKKQIQQQLSDNEQQLKLSRQNLEDYVQLSKKSIGFLRETAELFRASSSSHLFSGIFEEQVYLDRKAISFLEEEQEELIREQRQLILKKEELSLHEKKEES